jgi:bifunctional DNA-binding transcriptional regulator/antitoxin component of YhaV-PrlF toxin-antitoxin module
MEQTVTIDKNGNLTLPREYLKILGIFADGKVTLQSTGSQIIISSQNVTIVPKLSPQEAVKNAQAIVRQYVPVASECQC